MLQTTRRRGPWTWIKIIVGVFAGAPCLWATLVKILEIIGHAGSVQLLLTFASWATDPQGNWFTVLMGRVVHAPGWFFVALWIVVVVATFGYWWPWNKKIVGPIPDASPLKGQSIAIGGPDSGRIVGTKPARIVSSPPGGPNEVKAVRRPTRLTLSTEPDLPNAVGVSEVEREATFLPPAAPKPLPPQTAPPSKRRIVRKLLSEDMTHGVEALGAMLGFPPAIEKPTILDGLLVANLYQFIQVSRASARPGEATIAEYEKLYGTEVRRKSAAFSASSRNADARIAECIADGPKNLNEICIIYNYLKAIQ